MDDRSRPVDRSQLLAVFFMALMSPAIRLFPRSTVEIAGPAGWLSPLAALLAAPAALWLARQLHRKAEPMGGLGGLVMTAGGPVAGRAVLAIFTLWQIFYAGFVLRAGADRFVVMVYPAAGPAVFVFTALFLALAAALHDFRALARSAVLFRAVFLAVMAVVLIAVVPDVHPEALLPVKGEDVSGILLGGLHVYNPALLLVHFLFLGRPVRADRPFYRSYLLWTGLYFLLVAALCATAIGSFGAELATHFNYPFFVMVRNMSLLDLFDRVEALIITLWVFSDFIMAALLLTLADANLRRLFRLPPPTGRGPLPIRGGRWPTWLAAAGAGAAAMAFTENTLQFHGEVADFVASSNAALILVLLPLCLLLGRIRKKL